jgi:hypothetical protein
MRLYLGYAPIWFFMIVIIVCDVYITWVIYLSILQQIQISSDRSVSTENPLGPRTRTQTHSTQSSSTEVALKVISKHVYVNRQVFFRFALGPFLMIILHIPGSLLRLSQAAHLSMSPSQERFWSFAQAICDPMHGTINAAVWVLSDHKAREEWSQFLFGKWTVPLSSVISALSPSFGHEGGGVPDGHGLAIISEGDDSRPLSSPFEEDNESTEHRGSSLALVRSGVLSETTISPPSSRRQGFFTSRGRWIWGASVRSESSNTTGSLPRSSSEQQQQQQHLGSAIKIGRRQTPFVTFESDLSERGSSA